MQENFDTSIVTIKADVEEALALLENETLIQRSGDIYEYLTDEEQDVEAEIKNTEVDSQAVADELEKMIFDGVIRARKIRWDESGQDYPYTRKLDDNQSGREQELVIHVITPFYDHHDALEKHKTDTVYNDELRVVMPNNDLLMRDLILYKKAEKYISHETKTTQQDTVKRILAEKAGQNSDRYNQLKVLVSSMMGSATYLVGGKEVELSGDDGQTKVQRAFVELTKKTYTNLKLLRGQNYQETDIPNILSDGEQGLFGDEASLPEAQQEMFSFIQSNHRGGVRTTVKLLLEKYERKPYGWPYAAVLCTLAHLCARGKIEVRESTNLLDDTELTRALTNSNLQGNLILDPQVEFTPGQTKKLKDFYNDYFDKVAHATEAKALANETQQAFLSQKIELEKLHGQAVRYPFLRSLASVISDLSDLESKPYKWFVTELTAQENKWLDEHKDQVIDPIVKFMKGPNKERVDEANLLLAEHEANLSYIDAKELDAIKAAVVDPNIFKNTGFKVLNENIQNLKSKLNSKIAEERSIALEKIESFENKLNQYDGYIALNDARKAEVQAKFQFSKDQINQQSLIAMIRDIVPGFERDQYSQLFQQIESWNTPPGEGPTVTESNAKDIVGAKDLTISFNSPLLESEEDVEAYIDSYKQALVDTIKQGKKVRV
jgi:hypothetical protein